MNTYSDWPLRAGEIRGLLHNIFHLTSAGMSEMELIFCWLSTPYSRRRYAPVSNCQALGLFVNLFIHKGRKALRWLKQLANFRVISQPPYSGAAG
jgi:hypothetical protein